MSFDRVNPERRTAVDEPAEAASSDAAMRESVKHESLTREPVTAGAPAARDVPVRDVPVRDADQRVVVPGTGTVVSDRPVVTDRPVETADTDPVVTETVVPDRQTVVAREKEAFGGVKIGSAFFGWLTATGTAVLLTAFVAAGGTAVGVLNGNSVSNPDFGVTWRGVRGAIVIVGILLVSYFCGGYVAGRMARFNGLKQGAAVFVWAIVFALLVGALGALAGTQWNALNAVTGVPRFSAGPTRVTADGMLVGLLAVAAALVGALLGGLAGMRFHRRVDRAGWIA